MGTLDGKIALITDGDSGIGLVTVRQFVKEGAHVFITARRHSQPAAGVEEIEALDLRGTGVEMNVTGVRGEMSNSAELDRVFAQIKREKGKLDVLFASAANGVSSGKVAEGESHSNCDLHVNGLFFTVEKATPLLTDGASIILLSGSPRGGTNNADSVAGFAIRSLARTWTKELKDRGIRVNAVNPGPVGTGQQNDVQTSREPSGRMLISNRRSRSLSMVEEVTEAVVFLASDDSAHIVGKDLILGGNSFSDHIPIGRLGTPEEVAKAVVFLASDDSSGITGKELFVGAGFAEL